jgi:regulator of chromosome condensation
MGLPNNKRSRLAKDAPRARPTKIVKSSATERPLNEAPTQRLDVYVFGSGESGELGLGHLKRNGKAPTDVKRPRLNDLLDAKTVGVVQFDVGGMRKSALLLPLLRFPSSLLPSIVMRVDGL